MSQAAPTMDLPVAATSAESRNWLHLFTLLLVAMTFVLIVAGGNVTSKNAGLAVPDWPLSFGSVNPEGWVHQPLVRDEHGHRLIGATVGLLVITLVVWLKKVEPRAWVRRLGYIALAAVIVQGVMGGLRVTEKSLLLAIVHGCFAQAFFCLTIALAAVTSARWPGGEVFGGQDASRDRALRFWAAATVLAVYGQLVLGALLRHTGMTAIPHILGAVVVGMCLIQAALHVFSRPASERPLGAPTLVLFVLFGLQILLGVGAYVLVLSMTDASPANRLQAYVPTIHVGVGAVILGVSFFMALRTFALTVPATSAASHRELAA